MIEFSDELNQDIWYLTLGTKMVLVTYNIRF